MQNCKTIYSCRLDSLDRLYVNKYKTKKTFLNLNKKVFIASNVLYSYYHFRTVARRHFHKVKMPLLFDYLL